MRSSESENRISMDEIPSLEGLIEINQVDFDPGYILYLYETNWDSVSSTVTQAEIELIKFLSESFGNGEFSPQGLKKTF
jgi:hypothetical protein